MKFKLSYMGIVAIVAVVIGVIGFFLKWVDFGMTAETGIQIFMQNGGPYTMYAVAILVSLIGSLIFALVFFHGKETAGIKFLFVVLGAIVLAVALLMFFDLERDAGTGIFLEMAAGVLLFITAIYFALRPAKA